MGRQVTTFFDTVIASCCTVLIASIACADPSPTVTTLPSLPIAGFVHRLGSDIELSLTNNTGRLYQIRAEDLNLQPIINRLSEGDFVMAMGRVDAQTGSIGIQTIDLVGLRGMIGMWNTKDAPGTFNFRSYSDLNITAPLRETTDGFQTGQNFRYSVVPSFAQNAWIMFLSDDKQTQMGLLDLQADRATLQLMNSDTGNISRILHLQKLN